VTKKLVLSDGTRERELHLVGRIVVGRDPACEISHDDSLLSRRHAEFVTSGNTVTVRDLGSRNGVFVNGARASEHRLEPGDIVQIGPLRARFVVDSAPRSMSPEALDVDRTAVIRKVSPPPPVPAVPVHPAVALAFEEVDEDATRLVIEPRPSAFASGSASASESAPLFMFPAESPGDDESEDEDITRFTAAPEVPALRPVLRKVELPVRVAPVVPAVAPPRVTPSAPPVNTLGTFVYGQLLTLALAILGAAAVALVMWRRSLGPDSIAAPTSSLAWFALPVAAAIAGTFVIGAAVNRRITSALAENDRSRT